MAETNMQPQTPESVPLKIEVLTLDPEVQCRARQNRTVIMDYAEAVRDGIDFPPITVFRDGDAHWVADGFHRVAAVLEAGEEVVRANILEGSRTEAILFSAGANTDHGLRRTNKDKRRAVEKVLHIHGDWADTRIATVCRVSARMVGMVRTDLRGSMKLSESSNVREASNGRCIDTSGIGRKCAAGAVPAEETHTPVPFVVEQEQEQEPGPDTAVLSLLTERDEQIRKLCVEIEALKSLNAQLTIENRALLEENRRLKIVDANLGEPRFSVEAVELVTI